MHHFKHAFTSVALVCVGVVFHCLFSHAEFYPAKYAIKNLDVTLFVVVFKFALELLNKISLVTKPETHIFN